LLNLAGEKFHDNPTIIRFLFHAKFSELTKNVLQMLYFTELKKRISYSLQYTINMNINQCFPNGRRINIYKIPSTSIALLPGGIRIQISIEYMFFGIRFRIRKKRLQICNSAFLESSRFFRWAQQLYRPG
jgi:hypothetical protein